jgi:hypothetical protein
MCCTHTRCFSPDPHTQCTLPPPGTMRVNCTVLRFAVSALPASGTAVAVVGPSIAILGARGGAIGAHIDGPSVSDELSAREMLEE